jgi:hypothetical protein
VAQSGQALFLLSMGMRLAERAGAGLGHADSGYSAGNNREQRTHTSNTPYKSIPKRIARLEEAVHHPTGRPRQINDS